MWVGGLFISRSSTFTPDIADPPAVVTRALYYLQPTASVAAGTSMTVRVRSESGPQAEEYVRRLLAREGVAALARITTTTRLVMDEGREWGQYLDTWGRGGRA